MSINKSGCGPGTVFQGLTFNKATGELSIFPNGNTIDLSDLTAQGIETLTTLSDVSLNNDVLTITYIGEDGLPQTKSVFLPFRTLVELSGLPPIAFDANTGQISISQASTTTDGFLSHDDWNLFNNKASTTSPNFTGVPTAPTAPPGTNNIQIATTAYVASNPGTDASVFTTGTFPDARLSSSVVLIDAVQTLTNKSLISPNITTPTGIVKANVGLGNVVNVDNTNASTITSGTLADARLSSNVALKNIDNAFSATQTITGNLSVSGTITNSALTSALAAKQDTLVSASNIKTINSISLLGSGNIDLTGGGGGVGDVVGPSSSTDNALPRFDGVGGKTLQGSGIIVDDSNNINIPGTITNSALTTALGLKAPLAGPTFTGTVVLPSTTSIGSVSNVEIGYVDGVTSAIQTQIDGKAATVHTHAAGDVTSGTFADARLSANVALLNVANLFTQNQTITKTTEQFRLRYDASNYFTTVVASTGSTTFDLGGTTPTFTFGKSITSTGFFGPITTGNYFARSGFGSPDADPNGLLGASTSMSYRATFNGSSATVNDNDSLASVLYKTQPFTTAASGLHPLATQLGIMGGFATDGGADIQDAATVYIQSSMTGLAPLGNNYALWVNTGQVRIGDLAGTGNRMVIASGTGELSTQAIPSGSGAGDVVGPASAIDNALVRFDTTTGKLIQNSPATLSDSGQLTTGGLTITALGGTGTRGVIVDGSNVVGTAITEELDQTNYFIKALQALGSPIKAETANTSYYVATAGVALSEGHTRWQAVYLSKAATLTGVIWQSVVAGIYTANLANKIGLYSYDNGTGVLTLRANSANDGNLWKATAGTMIETPFVSTYAAAEGLYFVAYLYNNDGTGTITPPQVLSNVGDADHKFNFFFTTVDRSFCLFGTSGATGTDLLSTVNVNTLSAAGDRRWFALY